MNHPEYRTQAHKKKGKQITSRIFNKIYWKLRIKEHIYHRICHFYYAPNPFLKKQLTAENTRK